MCHTTFNSRMLSRCCHGHSLTVVTGSVTSEGSCQCSFSIFKVTECGETRGMAFFTWSDDSGFTVRLVVAFPPAAMMQGRFFFLLLRWQKHFYLQQAFPRATSIPTMIMSPGRCDESALSSPLHRCVFMTSLFAPPGALLSELTAFLLNNYMIRLITSTKEVLF